MKKKYRVGKNFKIVKRSCSLNRYYRVDQLYIYNWDAAQKQIQILLLQFKPKFFYVYELAEAKIPNFLERPFMWKRIRKNTWVCKRSSPTNAAWQA